MKKTMNHAKEIILRLCILILVPLLISFVFLNPFKEYEMKCSTMECDTIDEDGVIPSKIMELNPTNIDTYFIDNFLERIFKVGFGYNKYNLKIEDLSYVSNLSLANMSFKVEFRENNYTLPYQESIIFQNIELESHDRVKLHLLLTIKSEDIESNSIVLRTDYKIRITRSFWEYFSKFIVILITWLALFRLLRKTTYYVFYKNRD